MSKPTLGTLRPDDHLPDTVAILAGDCEGVIDLFDLPGMCKQRCKPQRPRSRHADRTRRRLPPRSKPAPRRVPVAALLTFAAQPELFSQRLVLKFELSYFFLQKGILRRPIRCPLVRFYHEL